MADPLDGYALEARGPYVGTIARPDGSTVVVSGASDALVLMALQMALEYNQESEADAGR